MEYKGVAEDTGLWEAIVKRLRRFSWYIMYSSIHALLETCLIPTPAGGTKGFPHSLATIARARLSRFLNKLCAAEPYSLGIFIVLAKIMQYLKWGPVPLFIWYTNWNHKLGAGRGRVHGGGHIRIDMCGQAVWCAKVGQGDLPCLWED